MPTKPYFKLTIGKKPYTSADMKFGCGRIRIDVSDAHPDRGLIASLCDVKWSMMCRKVLAYYQDSAATIEEIRDGNCVTLTQPGDRTLAEEVAMWDEKAKRREKPSAETLTLAIPNEPL